MLLALQLVGCGRAEPVVVPETEVNRLVAAGKLDEAESLCRVLVKEDPASLVRRGSLARVLCLRGDSALSEAGFFRRDSAQSDKAVSTPRGQEAMALFAEAEKEARAALALPAGAATKADRAKVMGTLGLSLYRLGRSNEAIKELDRALAEDGKIAELHNTLGLIYHDLGKSREAHTEFLAAIQLDSGMAEAAYNLALHYEGELAELESETERIVAQGGELPADMALRKAETRQAAADYYRRYLRCRFGRAPDKEEVEARIREMEGGIGTEREGTAVPFPTTVGTA